MNVKKSIDELKENITNSLQLWAEDRIDDLAAANPRLKIASVYLKRGAKNYLTKEKARIGTMVDNAALFLCDEDGKVDADLLFNDMLTMFREMDETPFGKGFIHGTIGKGTVSFALPDNPITNMLFGNTGAIKITDSDLIELKKLLTVEEIS